MIDAFEAGFEYADVKTILLSDREIFGIEKVKKARLNALMDKQRWISLSLNKNKQAKNSNHHEKTLNFCGQWTRHDKENGERKYFQLRKSHLKPEYHDEYDEAVDKYISKHLDKESLC